MAISTDHYQTAIQSIASLTNESELIQLRDVINNNLNIIEQYGQQFADAIGLQKLEAMKVMRAGQLNLQSPTGDNRELVKTITSRRRILRPRRGWMGSPLCRHQSRKS